MTTKIPDPLHIHPFIKFCRYTFLTAGVIYGVTRKKTLQIREASRAEEKEKKRIEREKQLEREKELAQERDLKEIIAIFTNKPISDIMATGKVDKVYKEQGTQTTYTEDISRTYIEKNEKTITEEGKCEAVTTKLYEDDNEQCTSYPTSINEVYTK